MVYFLSSKFFLLVARPESEFHTMSVFTPDRTSQLESFCFRIERTVESLTSRMHETFNKLFTSVNQLAETQALSVNSLDTLHKRLDTIEQTQLDFKSELGAMNKKLDTIIELLNKRGM